MFYACFISIVNRKKSLDLVRNCNRIVIAIVQREKFAKPDGDVSINYASNLNQFSLKQL
jgi:hypothetical protein